MLADRRVKSRAEEVRCCGSCHRGAEGPMKVVLDTNVVVSGIFFGGVPGRILGLI